jgi:hypothetical protein
MRAEEIIFEKAGYLPQKEMGHFFGDGGSKKQCMHAILVSGSFYN